MTSSLLPLLVGNQQDILLSQLRAKVAQLESQNAVGNIAYGGPLKTTNAPNVYTVGPFVRDLDASFPAEFDLLVPQSIIRLVSCKIRLKPKAIRSSVAVASSSVGTPSGGGSTSGAGASHSHTLPVTVNFSVTATNTESHTGATIGPSGTDTVGSDQHVHDGLGIPYGPTDTTSVPTSDHTHGFNHSHDILNSAIAVAFGGGETTATEATHTHSTPAHTHPSHDHSLTLAIAEGGSATSVRLYIDNVDRSAALGGPWSAAAEVDITQYLVNSRIPAEPITGVHPIKFTSTTVGAIEAFMDFFVVAKPAVWSKA